MCPKSCGYCQAAEGTDITEGAEAEHPTGGCVYEKLDKCVNRLEKFGLEDFLKKCKEPGEKQEEKLRIFGSPPAEFFLHIKVFTPKITTTTEET